jgi:hypothetical protein
MGYRMSRAMVVASLLALVLAGCGDSKKSNRESTYKPPPSETTTAAAASGADAVPQDAEAKSAARSFVSEVEVCFIDNQDYTACKDPADTKADVGSGPGQVEVTAAEVATYTLVAHSKSGTDFTIEKTASGIKRTCDKPDTGGCKSGGTW